MEVLRAIRDVAIIILAIETIVIGVMVIVLIWQVWKLIGLVRRHADSLVAATTGILTTVKSGADAAAESAHEAKAAVTFVSARTVMPVVEFYSVIHGAARFARAVFGDRSRRGPSREEKDEP